MGQSSDEQNREPKPPRDAAKLPVIPGLGGILPIAAGVMVFYADDESLSCAG